MLLLATSDVADSLIYLGLVLIVRASDTGRTPVRTKNFVTLYFQKFRAISSNPYPSQMALSVNG